MTTLEHTPSSQKLSTDEVPRILIVDDEPGFCHTIGDILMEAGWSVETTSTGQAALDKAREQFFHIAVVDVRLPDMVGTDLLMRLKERWPETGTIMVTGYASLQTCMSALNGGASAYLIKPVSIEQLVQTVDQALDRQRALLADRRLLAQSQQQVSELEAREAELSAQIRRLEQELASLRASGR